jgi:heme exporter protein D
VADADDEMLGQVRTYFGMSGYGGYIWAAYGFAAVILVSLVVVSVVSARRRRRELDKLEALVPRRRRKSPAAGPAAG